MLELIETTVAGSVNKGNIVLMFFTGGCPLCPPIIIILQKLEKTESGKFLFAKVLHG